MKRYLFPAILSIFFLAFLLSVPSPGTSQEGETKILDLIFTVQDMGGKVQDIKVKETKSEIRIELAADVLFDFDKADILTKAQEALKQVAEVIREKAKGVVQIEGHTDSKGSDTY